MRLRNLPRRTPVVGKRLIVNGDDLGATEGISRGIVEAHVHGVLTSASVMVDAPAAVGAISLAAEHPSLDLGLHLVADPGAGAVSLVTELERQLERFVVLAGRLPTHVDSHHDVHRTAAALPVFLAFAERHALPLRGFSGARPITSFYGQWGGETHLEQVGVPGLERILASELDQGVNELCCHPGYVDHDLRSSYGLERRAELRTLCDPVVPDLLRRHRVGLATFGQLGSP